jgi:hypothetical protein
MSHEAVTSVLDEVVPPSMRGLNLRRLVSEIGCNKSEETEYDNMLIVSSTNDCMPLKRECETRATVTLKRTICRGQSKQLKPAS